MKRCIVIVVICFILSSCISGEELPEMELTHKYQILIGKVSNIEDIESTATTEKKIKIPILYEVVSEDNTAKLMERIDFAQMWIKIDSAWYVLGKSNYIKIDTVAETCIVADEKQEYEPYTQDIFEMMESHPEFFAVPQITDKPYKWNGTGQVTLEQIEATNSADA